MALSLREEELMEPFYIVTYESGAENRPVPTWAAHRENPFGLERQGSQRVKPVTLPELPGGFQLHGLLSAQECQSLIKRSEILGYSEDAAVSLPRKVRHNENLVWIADELTHDIIWKRCAQSIPELEFHGRKKALGINRRFRFYKYGPGDFFKPHTDGSWPGSAVHEGRLYSDFYGDRYSLMTFLILLSDDFSGGATRFWVDKDDPGRPARTLESAKSVDIMTPAGSVLCFPHGHHPLHCLHSSEPVSEGTKYIIRTDILYEK